MRHVTEATSQAINALAKERGTHKLDILRAQGVYEALLEFRSIALGRRESGHRSLGDITGLTTGQLDKALKFLCDAGLVNLETYYGRVFASIREAPCGQDQA